MKLLKSIVTCISALALTSCAVNPKVIGPQEREARIQQDWQAMFAGQEPLQGSMTIYQAMARAVKYNLDVRVKSMEQAYAMADANYSQYNMLPSLVSSAGYTTRNNSFSVISPTDPSVISTSEDRAQREAHLQFSWNALDFGISYLESKQKADLYLIAQERKRKILQQVVRDTRNAYWRAWSAQQLLHRIRPFQNEIKHAIAQSKQSSDVKLTSPTQAAFYRAELWQTYKDMSTLDFQLTQAKPELLAMINAKPNSTVHLSQPKFSSLSLPSGFPKESNKLEMMALQSRPELREEDYRKRISLTEVKKARLKMLPNISITGGANYDSNSFLVNKHWADFGAQLSWDVIRLFAKYQAVKVAKLDTQVADMRRMALSMSVITQVEIAKLRYQQAQRDLAIAQDIKQNRYQFYHHLKNETQANLSDQLALINAKAKWLTGELAYSLAYSEWRNAAGQLMDSVGYDPLNQVSTIDISINQLAEQIQRSLGRYSERPVYYPARAAVVKKTMKSQKVTGKKLPA